MSWEVVVGLETHAQLRTRSKIFSGASTAFGAAPNAQACAIDIALPGVLPVLNAAAVELAIRFGLAVGATINRTSIFARKNYFYPDLPKGYQISQYEMPIAQGGAVSIALPEGEKRVALTRAHLEEDAGKSLHEDFHGMSGIDLNRAGTPLLEIVSEPDLRSAREAVAYARALHALVVWIGVCDGNMQEGSFRCDANVSVRRAGEPAYGTRCEIKNLNSFRFMERAIEFEAQRQIGILEVGGRIDQETRLYDPERDETRPLRSKEEAHDYRYFPDPDLLPLVVRDADIERIRAQMPELPAERRKRFVERLSLPPATAAILTASRQMADYFEAAIAGAGSETVRQSANWIAGNTSAKLNALGIGIEDCPVGPAQLRGLIDRLTDGTLSAKLAREVDDAMWAGEGGADEIIARRGLEQITDVATLETTVDEVLAANPRQVEDYRAGKQKAFNSLVGQVMKATRGKANPAQVNEILRRRLG
ncbi:MAG: Asp-tRNA(Asn)/Glu-tRNA(Gln) amidotransferase subunit GatB [Burkholderiales bacterium]|nr:Asp-tRNA(Asn)/Glu-tRNA(Gln) amidotransferase subunit GatB [Burkholderiales bacterium]